MLWIAQEVKEIKKIKEIIKIQSGIIVILESNLASDLIFLGNQWSNQDYQSHLDRPVGLIWKSGVQMWSCPLIVWFGSPWRSRFWSGHFFKDIFVIQHHWSLRSLWLKEYQSHLGTQGRNQRQLIIIFVWCVVFGSWDFEVRTKWLGAELPRSCVHRVLHCDGFCTSTSWTILAHGDLNN